MKEFLNLYNTLEISNSTEDKIAALLEFFNESEDADKVWAIALFTNKRPKRTITTNLLREWVIGESGIPKWLFEETHHFVGDMAETISVLFPNNISEKYLSLDQCIRLIQSMQTKADEDKREIVLECWRAQNQDERFLFNKLITGGFRLGVSQRIMVKALAQHVGEEDHIVTHRLLGQWDPFNISFTELLSSRSTSEHLSKPYPFYKAKELNKKLAEIGEPKDWIAEWKWTGMRVQLIVREQEVFLWSKEEEMIIESFPEFKSLDFVQTSSLVLEGVLMIVKDESIQDFNALQKRLSKKKVSKKMLAEYPAHIIAYDVIEYEGEDIREKSQDERKQILAEAIDSLNGQIPVTASELASFSSWEEIDQKRKTSRDRKAEGVVLKSKYESYPSGTSVEDWYTLNNEPYIITAVLIYAQRGERGQNGLFSDYTFAVWDEEILVPFAKAATGLEDEEFLEMSRYIRKNTIEKFGPVRSVSPELVFEISFKSIAKSTRHKSGVALKIPRISRWVRDKSAAEADTLDTLLKLL